MKQIHANLKPIKPMSAILGIVSRHRLRNRRAFTTRRTYTTRTRKCFTYHYVNDKMM